MENEKLFDFMSQMYSEMKDGFKQVNERLAKVESEVKKTNITIENDIMPKIDVLFDGHIQNSDKLDRIEKEVNRQDEIILRKIK